MRKSKFILAGIQIPILIMAFILSFYVDWIDNNYSKITGLMFIVLIVEGIVYKLIDIKK